MTAAPPYVPAVTVPSPTSPRGFPEFPASASIAETPFCPLA